MTRRSSTPSHASWTSSRCSASPSSRSIWARSSRRGRCSTTARGSRSETRPLAGSSNSTRTTSTRSRGRSSPPRRDSTPRTHLPPSIDEARAGPPRRRHLVRRRRDRRAVATDDPDLGRTSPPTPSGVNARLGQFSTFVNLLDLCAVAVPGGRLTSGVPVGFTLIAPALSDTFLLSLTDQYQRMVDRPLGALARRRRHHSHAILAGRSGGNDRAVGGRRCAPEWSAAQRATHLTRCNAGRTYHDRGGVPVGRSRRHGAPKTGLVPRGERCARSRSKCGTSPLASSVRSSPPCRHRSPSASSNSPTDRG